MKYVDDGKKRRISIEIQEEQPSTFDRLAWNEDLAIVNQTEVYTTGVITHQKNASACVIPRISKMHVLAIQASHFSF